MIDLYNLSCRQCSQLVTNNYSTSFSLGIKMFAPQLREPIYNIYGFVRFADEIVDTFHDHDKPTLIKEFREDTFRAIERGISLNPILHSFQETVRRYRIEGELIDAFLNSMEMDLDKSYFDRSQYETYIYGSAEVVGLMCLRVFVDGDQAQYDKLKDGAMKLGSAFQKINFLRDIKSDHEDRGRVYFPDVQYRTFDCSQKRQIESEIQQEFDDALVSIRELPSGARLGVYLAYNYYLKLLKKIKKCSAMQVREQRIRVRDVRKIILLGTSTLKYQLRAI
ncbi:MAG: phytoene/squalene synthase family protein [Bacteroidota bacterium]